MPTPGSLFTVCGISAGCCCSGPSCWLQVSFCSPGAPSAKRRYDKMFKRCLVAENRKVHASRIWIVFFVLPVISAIYGTYNYLQNLGILTGQWYSLWTQHTLFYALFFFPVLVGVYAAYLWRLEHMGHNWNLIMAAPVRPLCLFLAK